MMTIFVGSAAVCARARPSPNATSARSHSAQMLMIRVIPGQASWPALGACGVRIELQRDAVHAVAFAGRARAVGKDVAEMSTALRAVDLYASHAVAGVGGRRDRAFNRLVEAWPAGAALELRIGREERLATASTVEGAGTLLEVEGAGAGALGTVLAQHVKLLGRQRRLPGCVGFLRHAPYSSTALLTRFY